MWELVGHREDSGSYLSAMELRVGSELGRGVA